MEEQIKALIEKYEVMGEKNEYVATDDFTMGYNEARAKTLELVQADLKQLLTTSQGNPDMV